jgi:hypothetical protein
LRPMVIALGFGDPLGEACRSALRAPRAAAAGSDSRESSQRTADTNPQGRPPSARSSRLSARLCGRGFGDNAICAGFHHQEGSSTALDRRAMQDRRRATEIQRTSFRRSEESVRVQPANNFLASHRASLARCGPSTSDPATAPSKSTISARAVAFASFTPAAFVHSRKRSANHSR